MGISSIDRATENLVDIGLENRVRSILAAGITLAPAADSGCSNSGSLVKRQVPAERRRPGLPKIDQSRLSGEKVGGGSIVSSSQ